MEIVRKFLTPDEIQPPNIRYNPECDCVEYSPDDGANWYPNPGLDPRSAPAYQVPARTGGDPQCDAAANMIAFLQQCVNADIQYADQVSLATAIVAIIYFIFPPAAIFEAILIAVGLVLSVGSVAIDDAFTTEAWDGLLCLFLSHLDENGQIDQAGLFALEDDISSTYPGTVASVFSAHNQTIGVVGWNNAGAKGTETGDCSICSTCETALAGSGQLWTASDASIYSNYDAVNEWYTGHAYAPSSNQVYYTNMLFTPPFATASIGITYFNDLSSGAHGSLRVVSVDGTTLYEWTDALATGLYTLLDFTGGAVLEEGVTYILQSEYAQAGSDLSGNTCRFNAITLCG